MGAAADKIALVEIVGADTAHEELMHQGAHGIEVVIDSSEEDTLVAEGNAVIGESFEGGADFEGEFAGMVDVDADKERMVFLQDAAEFGSDALGEENGDAGADAEEFEMGNGPGAGEELVELFVREEEGISTREEDIADFGVLFEVAEGFVEIGVELLLTGSADDAAAGAVAAVGGAAVGDEEENPVGVTMNQAGDGHVGIFAAGVGHFFRG